jgi:large subunit ribosomal protein L23
MRLTGNIIKSIVTEKSLSLEAAGKYVFQVTYETSAGALKNELKKLYGVDVTAVNTIILPGKKRRKGKTGKYMKTAQRKKMIVTLKKGQKLDVMPKE